MRPDETRAETRAETAGAETAGAETAGAFTEGSEVPLQYLDYPSV